MVDLSFVKSSISSPFLQAPFTSISRPGLPFRGSSFSQPHCAFSFSPSFCQFVKSLSGWSFRNGKTLMSVGSCAMQTSTSGCSSKRCSSFILSAAFSRSRYADCGKEVTSKKGVVVDVSDVEPAEWASVKREHGHG